jgi:methionine-rich copper-binding protein CopC
MASLARGALVVVLGLLLAAQGGRGAHAHAVLIESAPAADAVLAGGPEQIALRFNEPVRPAVIRLLRARDEASVELGRPPPSITRCACRCPMTCLMAAMS